MVTWGEVRRWQPGPLQDSVGPLNSAYNQIVACSDDLRSANTPDGWSGQAASAAAGKINAIIDGLEEHAADIAAARRSFGDTGDAITGICNGVREAEELAKARHFTIGDDGAVIDNGLPPGTPEDRKAAEAEDRKTVAEELRERVAQVLRSATDVDDDFCAVLDKILSEHTIDAGANNNDQTSLAAAGNAGHALGSLSIPAPPAGDATAAANAGWWSTLSPGQRARMIEDYPGLVGNRDGVAAADRSAANLRLVGIERAGLLARREQLVREDGDTDEIEAIDGKLASLDAVDKMMRDDSGNLRGDRQLLSLDLSGERAMAAVAAGNVDTASHVAVFTPGMDSTVDGNMGDYVNDMEEVRRESGRMLDQPGASVAMVTWLGYEPPQVSFPEATEALSENRAREGAIRLESFTQGIDASRAVQGGADANPHMTLLGHSYGSTTTGLALSGNTGADNAVLFGSPGVSWGATLDGMNLPDGQIYSQANDDDPIAHLGVHGDDPSRVPGVTEMATGDTIAKHDKQPSVAGSGHGGYVLADGVRSTTEYNMAAVVAGRGDDLVIPKG
ncbi:alpha/beta hydrolase [Amycolatopsis suaedae]|uniref:DUF1023 domain-containing protein n=1 Tax=Amycolatopsis suaedae TaxID=2510978 RepID=A0A4Q7JGE2_9PSEU|nr:alpha/beta hydrolase [Amycolatopsis suaedae]RZQ65844.1 hypothetical protein EWH70_01840 [Amycolatopsis suaedae]